MSSSILGKAAGFDQQFAALRPKLHRYCARMSGSVIDGEDILQDALVKAVEALPSAGHIAHPEGWLFRIAHNAAIDFLRRGVRHSAFAVEADPDLVADPIEVVADRQAAAASLHTFMRLPVAQRACVILMDVLDYTLQEIGDILDSGVPAIKAALHRGRAQLRLLAREPDDRPAPALSAPERSLLAAYVTRFNARDFDAIRDMLADEVRLEVVGRARFKSRPETVTYFTNYSSIHDWRLASGTIEGRPAALVCDAADPTDRPLYAVLLQWTGGRVSSIRDFRYARYVVDDAALTVAARAGT